MSTTHQHPHTPLPEHSTVFAVAISFGFITYYALSWLSVEDWLFDIINGHIPDYVVSVASILVPFIIFYRGGIGFRLGKTTRFMILMGLAGMAWCGTIVSLPIFAFFINLILSKSGCYDRYFHW